MVERIEQEDISAYMHHKRNKRICPRVGITGLGGEP